MKVKVIFLLLFGFLFVNIAVINAQDLDQNTQVPPKQNLYKAIVMDVVDEGTVGEGEYTNYFQDLRLKILDGDKKDKAIVLRHGDTVKIDENLLVKKDDKVVLLEFSRPDGSSQYMITDRYRLDKILIIAAIFVLTVLVIARWKGIGSLIGLFISFFVIIKYVVPQILNGSDPLLTSIIGASVIMVVTLYLAHGFSKKTSIALASTLLTFIIVGVLSVVFVSITRLSGLGSEDAYALQFGFGGDINFKGLFLGGIMIGALGVLDDVTTSLTTAIYEIAKNHKAVTFISLLKSGMEIGREHIASLVNTLILAYAGASLPIFLFIVINPNQNPIWTLINSELIAEELVRIFAGSIGLILAVPITAVIASYFASRATKKLTDLKK